MLTAEEKDLRVALALSKQHERSAFGTVEFWGPGGRIEDMTGKALRIVDEVDRLRDERATALRDTFAAAALTGILANPANAVFSTESAVLKAYRAADEALKAREEKP